MVAVATKVIAQWYVDLGYYILSDHQRPGIVYLGPFDGVGLKLWPTVYVYSRYRADTDVKWIKPNQNSQHSEFLQILKTHFQQVVKIRDFWYVLKFLKCAFLIYVYLHKPTNTIFIKKIEMKQLMSCRCHERAGSHNENTDAHVRGRCMSMHGRDAMHACTVSIVTFTHSWSTPHDSRCDDVN